MKPFAHVGFLIRQHEKHSWNILVTFMWLTKFWCLGNFGAKSTSNSSINSLNIFSLQLFWIWLGFARRLEVMANSVLEICWLKNRQSTSDLLIRETRYWGGITILAMAHKARMEEFMSQPACYAKLNKIWRGDISLSTHYIRVVNPWKLSYGSCSGQGPTFWGNLTA